MEFRSWHLNAENSRRWTRKITRRHRRRRARASRMRIPTLATTMSSAKSGSAIALSPRGGGGGCRREEMIAGRTNVPSGWGPHCLSRTTLCRCSPAARRCSQGRERAITGAALPHSTSHSPCPKAGPPRRADAPLADPSCARCLHCSHRQAGISASPTAWDGRGARGWRRQ